MKDLQRFCSNARKLKHTVFKILLEVLCIHAYGLTFYVPTASNGDPNSPTSLHYTGSSELNQYEQALTAVGEIIQDYDSDKLFPVLGFGARIPPHGQVSHEFFVNMHPSYPYCEGVSGKL